MGTLGHARLSQHEAAEHLYVSVAEVEKAIASGDLPTTEDGYIWLDDLFRYGVVASERRDARRVYEEAATQAGAPPASTEGGVA